MSTSSGAEHMLSTSTMEARDSARDAAAQVLCLAHVDDFGVVIEVNAGLSGDGPDFGEEIHFWEDEFILFDGCATPGLASQVHTIA